ncbi:MAG: hypothetical protein WD271_09910 [Acidimicrobiia bacterium]
MEVRYHPLFQRWLEEPAEVDEEVFGEVMALLTALELHGRALEDEVHEESHAIVTARYDLRALRRTPPTNTTPYATDPPVLRIIYGYCRTGAGDDVTVVLIGGDKTTLGNVRYPRHIAEAQARLDQYCRQYRR